MNVTHNEVGTKVLKFANFYHYQTYLIQLFKKSNEISHNN